MRFSMTSSTTDWNSPGVVAEEKLLFFHVNRSFSGRFCSGRGAGVGARGQSGGVASDPAGYTPTAVAYPLTAIGYSCGTQSSTLGGGDLIKKQTNANQR